MPHFRHCFIVSLMILESSLPVPAASQSAERKTEYVDAVARGEGLLPWQQSGPSEAEKAFRKSIEERKTALLAERTTVAHPVMLTKEDIERARRNIATADWARNWYDSRKKLADHTLAQPADYVERMIPELSPTNSYGLTCPNCVGRKSQECAHDNLMSWDYHTPDQISCKRCGQTYPSAKYAETARLVCPRMGQTFTAYLNESERANPDDHTGQLAWHWVGYPIHVSFDGVIRHYKIDHMVQAAEACAMAYRISGDPSYAEATARILVRFAHCYRNWLYHDYWDTIADCDPMYAAWHSSNMPLEFKRHLCTQAYAKDTVDRAAMLQNYWGAGRIHPSTDALSNLTTLATAYDLVFDARDAGGRPLWTDANRALVERDLLLEYLMGAEPYVGGADKASAANNKAPRIYQAMAAVAVCLGLPRYADTALRGYEAVRDNCFRFDGFSTESPAYNDMYLDDLVLLPEVLHGFAWPAHFPHRAGTVNLYQTDPQLRLMFLAMFDSSRPDGRFAPLSDSSVDERPSLELAEIAAFRYPKDFAGRFAAIADGRQLGEYSIFHHDPVQTPAPRGLDLPEILFPAWMTAFLRHGQGPQASLLAFSFCPPGGHRHADNLAIFYADRNRAVLGDHGYMSDMPLNHWIHSTVSHNLVVVDDAEQPIKERIPRFTRMVTSPQVSVVEASSSAYAQCSEYRRLVAMIKGPDAQTFAVDIFRVKGGQKRHDYRLFSELASSDAADGSLEFTGLTMPPEPPLPKVGASLEAADIFGLRDVRGVAAPPQQWQAVWKEAGNRFRVTMLAPADRVEASNGPGQETVKQIGRRVRYLDVIREGPDLKSTFVALLEPSTPDNTLPITAAERLTVPADAGPDAVAVSIHSTWGDYLLLSEFTRPAEVAGVRFQGAFGLYCRPVQGKRWLLTSAARTLQAEGFGFDGASPAWSGKVTHRDGNELVVDPPRPADWPGSSPDVRSYLAVQTADGRLGLPVLQTAERSITIDRFPPPVITDFTLEAVHYERDR